MSQRPLDKVNIGYNKTNEEYIELLEEKNKLKKDMERQKEYQEKKKVAEREQGFNIYLSGANEARIKGQRKQELIKEQTRGHSQQDALQKGQRRMWRNASSNEKQNTSEDEEQKNKYHNPFDLNYGQQQNKSHEKGVGSIGESSPPKIRKRWGEGHSFSSNNQPTKVDHSKQNQNKNDEDDYSDSFEDPNMIQEEVKEEDEELEQSLQKDNAEIEQFLRTATKQEIDQLKQSLGNFGDLIKGSDKKKEDVNKEDDYIEEEFEEDIPEDSGGDDSEEERKQVEELKKKQQSSQMTSYKSTKTTTGAGGRMRPISATYSLAPLKVYQTPKAEFDSTNVQSQNIVSAMKSENQKLNTKPFQTQREKVQETPKQPNDTMKKPINTNPFKRPFSQNLPMRDTKKVVAQQSDGKNDYEKTGVAVTQFNQFESSQKSNKKGLDTLLQRIEVLDDTQRDQLLDVLNQIENTSLGSSQFILNSEMKVPPQNIDLNFLSPLKSQNKNKKISPQQEAQKQIISTQQKVRVKNELIIRVMNTFGNPHVCGLTEIELFDTEGQKIPIVPACISIKNLGQGPIISLERLINNKTMITDDKQMWIGYLPIRPLHLEILIFFNKDKELGGLKIWNYNKSIMDFTKGVKDVQIIVNEQLKWEGSLQGGKGHTDLDYSTPIVLMDGVKLPIIATAEKAIPIEDEIIDEELSEEEENKQQSPNKQAPAEMSEELRKYRSELNIKEKPDQTPLWLQGNQNKQNSIIDNKPDRNSQRSQQQEKRPRQGEKETSNTYNLLNNAQPSQQSTSIGDLSSVQSNSKIGQSSALDQRQSEFRNQQSATSLIKPNAMLSAQSQVKTKPFDVGKPTKLWTQPFNIQNAAQISEASEAVKNAVNKVNEVFNKQHPNRRRRENQKQIEESLDSLEFFKATNLGRLQNENDKPNIQNTKTNEKQERQKWGQASPQKSPNITNSSGGNKSHIRIKNPFPDQQQQSQNKQSSQTQRKTNSQQDDILDKFIGQNDNIQLRQNQNTQRQQEELIQIKQIDKTQVYKQKQSISPPQDKYDKQLNSNNNHNHDIIQNQNDTKPPNEFEIKQKLFCSPFSIPSLPLGQKIQINIVSTWGDMNYVGLTGIEIFDIEGRVIKIQESCISACPPDVNILPGYGSDPRTIDKLIDGHYFTNDDMHGWLAPFTAGEDHTISIDLSKKHQIAMIRIWNYNKSRIHSYRGVRLISCELDNKMIFRGEISKASGTLNDPQNCCEIILFTENNAILSRIDAGDWLNNKSVVQDMEDAQKIMQDNPQHLEGERPMTATKKFNASEIQDIQRHLQQQKPTTLFDERPQTSAIMTEDQEEQKLGTRDRLLKKQQELSNQVKKQAQQQKSIGTSNGLKGRVLELNILDSWGDQFYTGLNGMEILDENLKPVQIKMSMVDANPKDMNSIPGNGQDHRTLDKVFNGVNNTTDDHNMWLIPFNKGDNHTIKIDFGKIVIIKALKLYNYNKTEEDALRGAKQVVMKLDQKLITPKKGITIRKAPGLVHPLFDMGQIISLPYLQGWSTDDIIPLQRPLQDIGIFQEYECINLPIGFIFKLNLYSTHGDFYYIGLTGIELFDQNGNLIVIDQIYAEPQGVHKLSGMQGDMRTIDKLINGQNQSYDEQNMWLAPFKNTRSYSAANSKDPGLEQRIPNSIFIVFDQPVAISAIKLWNYGKTPSRGVNEFELLIDDKQVYRGFAKIAPNKQEWQSSSNKDFSSAVLFTSSSKIVEKLSDNVNYDTTKAQTVQLYNENKLMSKNQAKLVRGEDNFVFNEQERPQTMVIRK